MTAPADISAAEARHLALRAQGFGERDDNRRPGAQHIERIVARLGAIQIDAVNVLVRSHYLPLFSRLGPYPLDAFDDAVYRRGAAFEYFGHAASFLAIDLHPCVRWRMDRSRAEWEEARPRFEARKPGYVDQVLAEIRDRGPLSYTELSDPGRREKQPTKYAESSTLWWRWSDGKAVLDTLFEAGVLAVAGRKGFERRFDFAERVLPAEVLAAPTPSPADAQRTLVARAAQALGIATVKDLADYFRLPVAATKTYVRDLVESGVVHPVRVEGWKDAAYVAAGAKPSPVHARAVLSPFDSLVWERARTERIFGFRQKFELYVPAAKREYGYYVLPFLLGAEIVARVDLKADRKRSVLLVEGAFTEAGADTHVVAAELRDELRAVVNWLGLDRLEVGERGDLAAALRRAARP